MTRVNLQLTSISNKATLKEYSYSRFKFSGISEFHTKRSVVNPQCCMPNFKSYDRNPLWRNHGKCLTRGLNITNVLIEVSTSKKCWRYQVISQLVKFTWCSKFQTTNIATHLSCHYSNWPLLLKPSLLTEVTHRLLKAIFHTTPSLALTLFLPFSFPSSNASKAFRDFTAICCKYEIKMCSYGREQAYRTSL